MYTVREAMLPPNFSVTTAAEAAVGQMKQMKHPSRTSFTSPSAKYIIRRTKKAEMDVRINCNQKCHARGRRLDMPILQNVTYNRAKMTYGTISTNAGPMTSPIGWSSGTSLNNRYNTLPTSMAHSRVHFFTNDKTLFISILDFLNVMIK